MSMSPRNPELDALLGAYAVDAVDADERARVEQYLTENAAARAEVDELRESAAALALAPVADLSAPPELWNRIAADLDRDAGGDELAARRRRSPRARRWIVPLAAAAAIVVALLVARDVSLQRRLDDARRNDASALAASYARAVHTHGARQVALTTSNGSPAAKLVLLPDGTGIVVNDGLAPLPANRTYQLWVMMGNAAHPTVISAGVLGPTPQAASFKTTGPVVGYAITKERRGGVTSTTQPIYASGTLS